MTQDERTRMYIANCAICTLDERMKDCKACQFNIGLEYKQKQPKDDTVSTETEQEQTV